MPNEKWGEIGVAVIAPPSGESINPTDLEEFIRTRLASYKVPHHFYVWDEIPKSGYGKMAKRLVRSELERRLKEGSA